MFHVTLSIQDQTETEIYQFVQKWLLYVQVLWMCFIFYFYKNVSFVIFVTLRNKM